MSLVPVKEILSMAQDKNTSVIAFNCIDYNTIYSVCHAAENVGKPVLVMLYPEHHTLNRWIDPEGYAAIVKDVANTVNVPVGMHLDHCYDFNYIIRAIRAGFSCVMYDGSILPFEENIANTKKVVEVAHAFGVAVEAEVGHVGMAAADDQSIQDLYTSPEIAAEFIERSGCDSLAVAIGNAHGFYKETPHLQIARLAEINAATEAPLVLHGGTGIPDEQMAEAFVNGINKLNVGTEFLQLYLDTMSDFTRHLDGRWILDFPTHLQGVLIKYLEKKLELSKF